MKMLYSLEKEKCSFEQLTQKVSEQSSGVCGHEPQFSHIVLFLHHFCMSK